MGYLLWRWLAEAIRQDILKPSFGITGLGRAKLERGPNRTRTACALHGHDAPCIDAVNGADRDPIIRSHQAITGVMERGFRRRTARKRRHHSQSTDLGLTVR